MSTYVEGRVYCDERGCDETFRLGYRGRGGMSLTWIRYLARHNGWMVNGENARCPQHNRRAPRTDDLM